MAPGGRAETMCRGDRSSSTRLDPEGGDGGRVTAGSLRRPGKEARPGAVGQDAVYLKRVEEGDMIDASDLDPQLIHEVNGSSLQCRECCENNYESTKGVVEQASLEPSNNDTRRLRFRSLRPTDKAQIKALHEEWFPVDYKDDFYECVTHNRMAGTGDPLFSRVAYTVGERSGSNRRYENSLNQSNEWDNVATHLDISCTDEEEGGCCPEMTPSETSGLIPNNGDDVFSDDADLSFLSSGDHHAAEVEQIVGCVVGSFLDAGRCSNETATLLLPNQNRHSRLFYIMTLGTISEYRKQGLGSALVEKCLDIAEKDPICGVVYLHVITWNTAAIGFYERLGFFRVKEIEDYYSIEGEHHNCYLYARYLNGNRGHLSLVQMVTNLVHSFWKRISNPMYAVLSNDVHT